MSWSEVYFGKHKGKTLPQILFSDPDWFFWACDNNVFANKGLLNKESENVYNKAINIRIPKIKGKKMVAEYVIHRPTMKFTEMVLVPKNQQMYSGSSPTYRENVIDLSFPRQIAGYDKLGCKLLVSSVKYYIFGNRKYKMTKKRCEEFFNNNDNFKI
jgi:hypothetical protein